MAMAVAICRATWMEKTDGGKCNGNIGGKKHWQILGGGKSTGSKLNGKILAASKSPWQHTWQRKGKLALRAKAIATQVAKPWQKMWQGLKTRRVSGKSRWHIAWPKDIVCMPSHSAIKLATNASLPLKMPPTLPYLTATATELATLNCHEPLA